MPQLPLELLVELANPPKQWAEITENPRFFRASEELTTVDEAFTLLGHLLWRAEKTGNRSLLSLDRLLANYVHTHPGTLEAVLLTPENQRLLAFAQSGDDAKQRREGRLFGGLPRSLLRVLLCEAQWDEGAFLWQTVRQLDAVCLWRFALESQHVQRYFVPDHRVAVSQGLLRSLLLQFGLSELAALQTELVGLLAPSQRDTMTAVLSATRGVSFRLPELLPDDATLCLLAPEAIDQALADYRGLPCERYNDLLIRTGFLAEGEHIGEVISHGAQILVAHGVTRHQLAEALETFCTTKPRTRELTAKSVRYRGHHCEPFHEDDMYYLDPEVRGSADIYVSGSSCTEPLLFFGDMAPYLVRRACFFEGNVAYRLDPAYACRILAPILKSV